MCMVFGIAIGIGIEVPAEALWRLLRSQEKGEDVDRKGGAELK